MRSLALLIPILAVGGFFAWMLALSPIGKAVAERIRGGAPGASEAVREELDALRDELVAELQQLRKDVSELGERVDFAERLLGKQREAQRLAPPGGR